MHLGPKLIGPFGSINIQNSQVGILKGSLRECTVGIEHILGDKVSTEEYRRV
jgi:hypothetical protein